MAFRDRLQAYQNEAERAQAEREYRQRRTGGMEERARARQAEADEARRERVAAEREARREALSRSRAQAEVERFNRPSRMVPYQEQVPTAPAREPMAGGGGGGRIPPNMPGVGALPAPEGGGNVPAQRGGVPARIPQQMPMTLGAPGIRPPMAAGAAGAVLGAGMMARDMADEYIRRDREARAERSPAMAGARIGGTADREARRAQFEQQENERRMNEADADSARAAPARRDRPAPRRRAQGMSEADRLNEISLAFARGERPRGGAADTIGRAMGIEGYKKGGLIKPKAAKPVKKAMGGAVKSAPVAGRPVGRPATKVKPVPVKPVAKAPKPAKPMPAFKKGGKVGAKYRAGGCVMAKGKK